MGSSEHTSEGAPQEGAQNAADQKAEKKARIANPLLAQGARYLIVGFSSAAIELVLFYLLFEIFDVDVVVSNVTAITLATTYNFIMSRKYTFNSVSSLPRSIVLYLLLFAWNQLFSSWAIVTLMDWGLYALVAKILTMGMIVCWNFVLYRKVVFK